MPPALFDELVQVRRQHLLFLAVGVRGGGEFPHQPGHFLISRAFGRLTIVGLHHHQQRLVFQRGAAAAQRLDLALQIVQLLGVFDHTGVKAIFLALGLIGQRGDVGRQRPVARLPLLQIGVDGRHAFAGGDEGGRFLLQPQYLAQATLFGAYLGVDLL